MSYVVLFKEIKFVLDLIKFVLNSTKTFQDAVHAFSGGLDNTLKMFDLNTNTETVVGTHDAPIRYSIQIKNFDF